MSEQRQYGLAPALVEQHAALRVSDREREHVVDLLRDHAAQGRLTFEELEARIGAAYGARTRGELAALTADLPGGDRSDHPDPTSHRGGRGLRPGLSRPLVAFVAVNLVLVGIWVLSGGGYFWPAWPLLGWGLCLARPGPCGRRRAARGLTSGKPANHLTPTTGGGG